MDAMNLRFPPQTHIERLKLSAMYLSLQRGLRRSAWGSCAWGAFTLALGYFSRSHTILDSVWIAIGLFLLLEGAWVLRASAADPRVLRLEAAALLLLGLWNTVGLYFEVQSGMKPLFGARIIFVGIVQLVNAYATFRSYPLYTQVYRNLDRAVLHELELKIGDAWKRKSTEDPDVVDFKIGDKKCKAKFLPDMVIVFREKGRQISLAQPAEIQVESKGNKMMSKLLKVAITLDGETLKTEMKPEVYERWQKSSTNTLAPVVAR